MTEQNIRHDKDNFDQTFINFINAGELRVPRSVDGKVMGLSARNALDGWLTEVNWVAASGQASLYSFVIYHQQYDPQRPTPYNIATVELAEGPRLISTIIVDNFSSLRVGMPLQAEFNSEGQLVFVPAQRDGLPA